MIKFLPFLLLVLLNPVSVAQTPWKLVWSDEFNTQKVSVVDKKYWMLEIGGRGWGNSELQYYSTSQKNAYQDGTGNLVIKAIKEKNGEYCWYGDCEYTSARMITKGKIEQTKTPKDLAEGSKWVFDRSFFLILNVAVGGS